MNYLLTYTYLVKELLPNFLRKDKMLNILYSVVTPLQTLNNTFYAKTEEIYYLLKFNAQVIYLEKYLNDKYDSTQTRINISGTATSIINYLFNNSEGEDVFYCYNQWSASTTYSIGDYVNYKNKIYVATSANTGLKPSDGVGWNYDSDYVWFYNNVPTDTGYDFLVNVPTELSSFENNIKASVDLFCLADKTYKINFI